MNEDITRREALKKGALLGGAALVWVRPSVQTYGMSATLAAQASGTAGCTPGFWKNNTENWPVDPTTATVPWVPLNFPQPLVMDALGFAGGGGDAGAERNLFRAAAAGYLNALALGGYALTESDLAALVSEAQSLLFAGDRDGALAIAAQIDTENNAGCLIPADESGKDFEEEVIETEQQSDDIFGGTEEGGTEESGTQESGTEEPEAAPSQEPEDSPSENSEQPGKGKKNGGDDE